FLRGSSQGAHVSSFSAFVPLVSTSDSAEGFLLCPFPLTRAGRLAPVAHHRMDSGKECFEIERLVDKGLGTELYAALLAFLLRHRTENHQRNVLQVGQTAEGFNRLVPTDPGDV